MDCEIVEQTPVRINPTKQINHSKLLMVIAQSSLVITQTQTYRHTAIATGSASRQRRAQRHQACKSNDNRTSQLHFVVWSSLAIIQRRLCATVVVGIMKLAAPTLFVFSFPSGGKNGRHTVRRSVILGHRNPSKCPCQIRFRRGTKNRIDLKLKHAIQRPDNRCATYYYVL